MAQVTFPCGLGQVDRELVHLCFTAFLAPAVFPHPAVLRHDSQLSSSPPPRPLLPL